MKVIIQYESETRETEFRSSEIIYKYEISKLLIKQKQIVFQNTLVDKSGTKLEALLPVDDDIQTAKAIKVYSDDSTLIKESCDITAIVYRTTNQIQNLRAVNVDPASSSLVEILSIDIR